MVPKRNIKTMTRDGEAKIITRNINDIREISRPSDGGQEGQCAPGDVVLVSGHSNTPNIRVRREI